MPLTIQEKRRVTKLIDDGYAKVSADHDDIIEKDFVLNGATFFDLLKPETTIPNPAMNSRYQINYMVHSRLNFLAELVDQFASTNITVDQMFPVIRDEVERFVRLLPVLPTKH